MFEERAETIISVLNEVDNIKYHPDFDMYHEGDPEKIVARMRRNLDRLPNEMHCVRKTLTLQLQKAEELQKNTMVKMDSDTSVFMPNTPSMSVATINAYAFRLQYLGLEGRLLADPYGSGEY